MSEPRRLKGLAGLQQAFDEVRFGAARTLNLRESLPTGADAARRLDSWLREQQVQRAGEVLVITGRGRNSVDGIAVVREAALRVLHELLRKGIVHGFAEHTPGSFVVTLAPTTARPAGSPRASGPDQSPPHRPAPPTLSALEENTRERLRVLAERTLDALGVRDRASFVEDEMLRLFGQLGARLEEGNDREARLCAAIERAMADLD